MEQNYELRIPVELLSQGSKIFGMIHRPKGNGKFPAVVFCHGLAGHKIGKHRMYVLLAELLSKAGIASFRFDFRGSGESEGAFHEMSLEGEVNDALVALEFISHQPFIMPNKIGLFGRSFGGSIAVLAASRFKKIKSIALWAPVFNAVQWEEKWELVETQQLDENQRHELMRIDGQLPSMNFYKELFSMNLEKPLDLIQEVPMLHIHGQNDPVVGIDHAIHYEDKRRESKAPTKFIRLKYSDHDFTHPEEKSKALAETCKWFSETLE